MAGAAAVAAGGSVDQAAAVILTSDETIPPETAAYLAGRTDDPTIIAIGGPAALAFPDAESVVGPTRSETSVAVAERFFTEPEIVGIATGLNFADALTGGAVVGRADIGPGPMLLTEGEDPGDAVLDYLAANNDSIFAFVIFGGTAAISENAEAIMADALGF